MMAVDGSRVAVAPPVVRTVTSTRVNERLNHQIRPISMELGLLNRAHGSARYSHTQLASLASHSRSQSQEQGLEQWL